MLRYWWPGFEKHLLDELQRQQNDVQFCDTLLQTEGVSIPTHSCVLAALSPYLSEKLSTSPSPPPGQKYHLRLHAVKAKTLLKLVSLLYSGAMFVKGSAEQEDVLDLAQQFGITGLEEGQEGDWSHSRLNERHSVNRRTVQVQTEVDKKRDTCPSAENKTTATQTGEGDVMSPQSSGGRSAPASTPHVDAGPCLEPGSGLSAELQSHHLRSDETDTRKAESPTVGDQEDDLSRGTLSATGVEIEGRNGGTTEDGENMSLQQQEDLSCGEETGMFDVGVGMNLKRSHDTTESVVKVKLRRKMKTKHNSWEVVDIGDTNGPNTGPDPVHTEVQSSSSTDQIPKSSSGDILPLDLISPDSSGVLSLTHISPEPDLVSQSTSAVPPTPDQSTVREATPPLQIQDCVEVLDEQVEKLLEDIMMSLNFLPDSEENPGTYCPGQHLGLSPVQRRAAAGSGRFTDESGSGTNNTSTETGVHSGSTEENLPPCQEHPSDLPEATSMQLQHQEHHQSDSSLPDPSLVKSLWKINVSSRQVTSSDKSKPFLLPDKPTPAGPVLPSTFTYTGQKTGHYPELLGSSLQHNVGLLPLINVEQTRTFHNLSLLCTADMKLRPCLSPVPLYSSLRNPPSLLKHDWLRGNPASGQIPWTIIQTTQTSASPGEAPEPKKTKGHKVHKGAGVRKRRKSYSKMHPPGGEISFSTHTKRNVYDSLLNKQLLAKGEVSLCNNNSVSTRTKKTASGRPGATVDQRQIRTRSYLKRTQKPGDAANKDEKDVTIETNDNSVEDDVPEVGQCGDTHGSQTSILKEFKRFIKIQHSKTRNSQEKQKLNQTQRCGDTEETRRKDLTSEGSPVEPQLDHEDAVVSKMRRRGSCAAVDENHNWTLDQSVVQNRTSQPEDTDGRHGDVPPLTTRMRTEMELQHEINNTCHMGQTGEDNNRLQPAVDRRSPSSVEEDSGVVEEDQGEEKEEEVEEVMVQVEEEDEVDVLTFSPVRVESSDEELLNSKVVTDVEEDEVDVTGEDTD